jgi:hypothetical protein
MRYAAYACPAKAHAQRHSRRLHLDAAAHPRLAHAHVVAGVASNSELRATSRAAGALRCCLLSVVFPLVFGGGEWYFLYEALRLTRGAPSTSTSTGCWLLAGFFLAGLAAAHGCRAFSAHVPFLLLSLVPPCPCCSAACCSAGQWHGNNG